jgi:hypothetical protein
LKPEEIATDAVVYLEWVDSVTSVAGWHVPRDIGPLKPSLIIAAGIVVKCDPDAITLTSSLADNGNFISPLTIPWGCIERLDTLVESGLKPASAGQPAQVQLAGKARARRNNNLESLK